MKTFNLTVILALCLFVFACGGDDKPAANNTQPANATTPANTATPEAKDDTSKTDDKADSAESIGVPACDEYFAEMAKFMDNPKVPQATRDTYKKMMEDNKKAWKDAASTDAGKAGLETGCKAALDAAKKAFEAFK